MSAIKQKFSEIALPYASEIKKLMKANKEKPIDSVNIDQVYGGMRDVISIVTETSQLDTKDGIFFRGYSIKQLYENLPNNPYGSKEPLPEMMLGLLLLGRIPTEQEIAEITLELQQRAKLPIYVKSIIDNLPKNTHPMVKLTTAFSALNAESKFNQKYYNGGIPKDKLWEEVYEDALDVIAITPLVAAYIYNGKDIKPDNSLDWAGNLAHMLGDKDNSKNSLMKEYLRLHLSIHSDHEGGNASAYTCHVVGSTLASPYGAYAGAMHSLAGPLHGLASETALKWIENLIKKFGKAPSKKEIEEFINDSIANGKVVPGYGHAVLRITDPRFTAQMEFAKSHGMNNDILNTVWNVYETAPTILGHFAKIKNPYPNVDAHSGAVLKSLGFEDPSFYTVLFATSRSIGIMSQLIWDRVFGKPITRPKSVTSEWIKTNIINK